MKSRSTHIVLLTVSIFMGLYLSELLLGFYLIKSIMHFPVPPRSEQTHETTDYRATYRYNNISLRGGDFEPERLYDIVLLGDSFLFGQGVSGEKTLQGILEKKGYQVLNLSEIATNPIDYHHKLKVMLSQKVKAKNILVGLCMGNDFQGIGDKQIGDALRYPYRDRFLDYDFRAFLKLERLRYQVRAQWLRFCDRVGKRFVEGYRERVVVHDFEHPKRFYGDWLQFFTDDRPDMMAVMRGSKVEKVRPDRFNEEQLLKRMQLDDDSLDNTLRILRGIADAVHPARLSVLLIPDPYNVFGFRSPKYTSYIRRIAAGLDPNVQLVDLHGALTPDMHFPHDGHWNEKGHHAVADIMVRRVLTQSNKSGAGWTTKRKSS